MNDENSVDRNNAEVPESASASAKLDTENVSAITAPRTKGVKIALLGALAVIVALGVLVTFLIARSPLASFSADAEAVSVQSRSSATPSPTARPTASPKPTVTPTVPPVAAQPSPPAEQVAPAPPVAPVSPVVPGPPAPPPLPAPPAPVIPPLAIKTMSASVSGECKDKSSIVLTWTTTGANANTATMRIRSGGGSPVFDQIWTGLSASGSQSFWLDCTRPIWFFDLTVTNGTDSKLARLTFANGKTAGWS